MTLSGVLVRTIGTGVTGLGITAGPHMLAVGTWCEGSAGVLLFDVASGDLIHSFGVEGYEEGQLRGNAGLRLTPDGAHVLLAEYSNNRLSLFTVQGEFVRCIGVGVLNCPVDVEFTSSGDILVSDYGNRRICVFSPEGDLLRAFGSVGSEAGQFTGPAALAMHGDELYVLDEGSARVQVFS